MFANNSPKILGVEQDLLEEFLVLIRDYWSLVDQANYLLENDVRISGINVAITNQRDAISHFVTFLSNPDRFTSRDRIEQIAAAKEHIRRGILESYQIAVAVTLEKILSLILEYKQKILVLNDSVLANAPTLEEIYNKLNIIYNLIKEGRESKRNRWDDKWELGVEKFMEAFTEIKNLQETVDLYITLGKKIQNNRSEQIRILSEVIGVNLECSVDGTIKVSHNDVISIILPDGKIENQ